MILVLSAVLIFSNADLKYFYIYKTYFTLKYLNEGKIRVKLKY